METVQQNGRFTLFSSKFLSNIYSILYVNKVASFVGNPVSETNWDINSDNLNITSLFNLCIQGTHWYIKHFCRINNIIYSETLNNEYIERTHQMSYSSLSDNGMLQIFSFLIK